MSVFHTLNTLFAALALLFVPAVAWSKEAVQDQQVPLSQYLPEGEVAVEFMKIEVDPRAEELSLKLIEGMQKNRAWFLAYVAKQMKPGQPLPYHPNLGLTEEEYKELQGIKERGRLALRGIRKNIRINITDGVVHFEPVGWQLPQLESLALNLDSKDLTLGDEKFEKVEWKQHRKGGGIFGPWRGYVWSRELADADVLESMKSGEIPRNFEQSSLDLNNPLGTDFVYLYLRRRITRDGVAQQVDILFRYEVEGISSQPTSAEPALSKVGDPRD